MFVICAKIVYLQAALCVNSRNTLTQQILFQFDETGVALTSHLQLKTRLPIYSSITNKFQLTSYKCAMPIKVLLVNRICTKH